MLSKFSNLKPLSKNGSFINQNGTYTATGMIDNKKVKIYSPLDKNAIKLRLLLKIQTAKNIFQNYLLR